MSRCPPWPLCRSCRLDPPPRSLPPMRMTASWSSPHSRNSPNTRLWGDVRLIDRRFPSGRRAYPATVNRRSPDQVSVTPCSPPSRTLRAAPWRWPKRAILDGVCARCHWARAGRDGETAIRSNKETDQTKKGGEDTEYNTDVLDNGPHTRVGKIALVEIGCCRFRHI